MGWEKLVLPKKRGPLEPLPYTWKKWLEPQSYFFHFEKFLINIVSGSSIQFWSGFIPVNEGGGFTLLCKQSLPLPPRSILCILLLQSNTLTLLLHLQSPCLPRSSLLPLSLHFKLQCLPQNMAIIPPQNMPVPSHSIHLCYLNHCFLNKLFCVTI